MKDKVVNEILFEAMARLNLTSDQVSVLKNVLTIKLHDVDIVQMNTEIAVNYEQDNDNYLRRYAMEMKISGKAESTIRQYIRQTRLLFDFIKKNFRDITKDDVQWYLASLVEQGVSGTTVDNARKNCNQFFNWAIENEYIKVSPFFKIKPIKRNPTNKIILSEFELIKMRDCCNTKRELAILDFLASTGVRVSEAAALKVSDVDFAAGTVKVFATKTNEYRTVFLEPQALKHLGDYRMDLSAKGLNPDALFITERGCRPLKKERFEEILKKVAERAMITKHVTVHTLRKTLATKLLRKGMKESYIIAILGHESFDTTIKFYAKLSADDLRTEFLRCVA